MVANTKKKANQLTVKNDGIVLSSGIRSIDFVGGIEVEAILTGIGEVTVYIPAPSYQPYWPLGVTDPVERVTARISTPEGGEGVPFKTNGWSGTNQAAGRTSSFVLASPSNRTGFGGNSTFEVVVFDADGISVLDSYTTPSLTSNGVHTSPSGKIVVTITGYATDSTKFQAKPSVSINIGGIFTSAGRSGGRYHVRATHHTDLTTDGGQALHFTQSDVFLDTNDTTPAISTISGGIDVGETPGQVLTKHLSGIEYYILDSEFTTTISGIDQLNRNTASTSSNLRVRGSEFGLPQLDHSPFGTGSSFFSGWTNGHNVSSVVYEKEDWAITSTNYRYIGPTGNVDARPQDPWTAGPTVNSANHNILVDTYTITSTATFEGFDDEARREFIDGVGAAATTMSFGGIGSFNSESHLSVSGTTQALVFNSRVMVPNESTFVRSDGASTPNADWTSYKPDTGGSNPDYSALGIDCQYARRFTKTAGINIPSFQMVFSGTFAGANALADLQSGALEIYVYRINKPTGTPGTIGPPPTNTRPLRVHQSFNFAVYDDGLTIAGSGIREGTSSGNTINCTFGTGTPADTGFYCHVIIKNDNISINSISVTFF